MQSDEQNSLTEFGFQWHVTDRCNLRCAHCYQDDFTDGSELPLDDLKRVADNIFQTVSPRRVSVNVTGGEPFLLPHLLPLLRHLEAYSHLAEINLITNGTVIRPEILAGLATLSTLRHLKVSVEAGDDAVNDAIRGHGNLVRVRQGIAAFRQALPGVDVVLMVTLGRHNRDQAPRVLDWAREVGAAGVIVERFVPLGTGRKMADQVLAAADWARVSQALAEAADLVVDAEDLLPFRAWWFRLDDPDNPLVGALCNLGEESMGLMPDGTVYPCRRLPIAVGNARREPFAAILDRLKAYSAEALKPRLSGRRCGACPVPACAGCRALARALAGDLLADDPQCAGTF